MEIFRGSDAGEDLDGGDGFEEDSDCGDSSVDSALMLTCKSSQDQRKVPQ
jgi:hypothetical protein